MKVHALICIMIGVITLLIPHSISFSNESNTYNHMAHEYTRLYGCLTLSIGWLVWSTKDINDGRLLRVISETFAVCYSLQSLAMLRAQFTNPNGHTLIHWLVSILFLCIGSLYAYIRLFHGIKTFELPGMGED